jgi:hypothetical protein
VSLFSGVGLIWYLPANMKISNIRCSFGYYRMAFASGPVDDFVLGAFADMLLTFSSSFLRCRVLSFWVVGPDEASAAVLPLVAGPEVKNLHGTIHRLAL